MRLGALALLMALSPRAVASPCIESTVMLEGATAQCSGLLIPGSRAGECLANEAGLLSCRVALDGERELATSAATAAGERIASLEAALAASEEAARNAESPAPVTDWGLVGWGVVGGVLAGAGLALGLAYALR